MIVVVMPYSTRLLEVRKSNWIVSDVDDNEYESEDNEKIVEKMGIELDCISVCESS